MIRHWTGRSLLPVVGLRCFSTGGARPTGMILALTITSVTFTSNNNKMRVSLKKKILETVPTRCEGSRYKLTGARQSGRGPRARLCCPRFWLSRCYQMQFGRDMSCWQHLRAAAILCTMLSALLLPLREKIFAPGQNPLLAALLGKGEFKSTWMHHGVLR